ncbi:thioredoxin family protein [Sulfurimonas paralvinellae]|uniref:DUF255 domain-containing protein n=1 Tax=Sulfurimonas paralvinellae TaxID=317658 RepID=A0A7M1B979_9BACT|nr:thioredoxin family protein [Sulfurimonas paralvinellae]QOP46191.1 DUF255 domain-containing protein [Sulfurimonas paralvinellae]
MFKKIIIMTALLSVALFGADLHWAKDYTSGIAQAQKENKPVLFIISSHSCKYCLLLDRTTLKDDKVVNALNKDFIAIRSWTDKGDYIPQVLAQNTPGLPGIWFLFPNGDPMYQPLLGYVQAPNFQEALGIVKSEFDKNNKRVKK